MQLFLDRFTVTGRLAKSADAHPSGSGKVYSTDMNVSPQRFQISRRNGCRKPANTIYVGRPSRFGNPFEWQEHRLPGAVELYEIWIQERAQALLLAGARESLRGNNLGCWCRVGSPCRADALLRMYRMPSSRSQTRI